MTLGFDIETDGLLETVSKIHCLVVKNCDTNVVQNFYGDTLEDGLRLLMSAKGIFGHNIIKFDIPVIKKLYPWFTVDESKVVDTLVLSRLIFSNIKDSDMGRLKKGSLPRRLFGSHSLEAWGYRVGNFKGEYKDWYKEKTGDSYKEGDEWLYFSQEMLDYCEQDVEVTCSLYARLIAEEYSERATSLEHGVAWLMAQQERNGFYFDEAKAVTLYGNLAQRRADLERECQKLFAPWQVQQPNFIPKRDNSRLGYKVGVPVERFKTVEFNPNSRDHIANRLQALYGWKPTEFTNGGKPQVDEVVLGSLEYSPCKLLTEFLLVQKRISQLAESEKAWMKLCRNGRIHGSVNPNGAVTGRATHAYPNISQVPASHSPYGKECRELFTVPAGWVLVGADASGLELRCLAHFMARYDAGSYIELLLKGDIHSVNQKAAGLPTRDNAKTFIYAFLYGAGDEKIGSIVGRKAKEGGVLRRKFLSSLPALKSLIEAVKEASKRGYLIGLDGRKVFVRSQYSALNTLLQSAGALVCKKWLVILESELKAAGLKHGWDGDYCFCAWSHDECQIACRTPEVAQVVSTLATACVTKAGEYFNFRCPLAGESKVGTTWSDTH